MRDITGNTYGALLVVSKSTNRYKKESLWNCVCTCGNRIEVRTSKLTQGKKKSCNRCNKKGKHSYETIKAAKEKNGRVTFASLPLLTQLQLINEYVLGSTVTQLADKHLIQRDSLRDGIKLYRQKLNETYELEYMALSETTKLPQETIDKALATKFIEERLIDSLSAEDSDDLTSSEQLYCYIYVNTGSNDTALVESGLNKCLNHQSPVHKQLLGMYLRNKQNLREYISILQDIKLKTVKADKRQVQSELTDQVEQLRETVQVSGKPADRGHLLKAIELLGKTCGAFEERVRVTEVSAADALDDLLDLAKAEVKEIPHDPTAETWE